jgi:iron complex transport system ATP-binding protein
VVVTFPVRASHLGFSYGRRDVLVDVSLPAREGAVLALLGANGCGKTTLLKLLIGLLSPARGEVELHGCALSAIPVPELARLAAYVPQLHREAFAYSIADLVLMGRMPHVSLMGVYGREDRQAAREAMERIGIAHLARRSCTEVSGGERQLALIARAVAQGARLLVMDEPTNGLDYGHQVRLLEQIAGLAEEGFSFVFSTHHPDHALMVADRVIMLARGRVVADGPPGEVITGASLAELYGVGVRTVEVAGGRRVCVPSFRGARAGLEAPERAGA